MTIQLQTTESADSEVFGLKRTGLLFGIIGTGYLAFGFALNRMVGYRYSMMVPWPGTRSGLDLGLWVPCYAIGAVFAFFACVYTVKAPLGRTAARWHLWTSLGGAVFFNLGYCLLILLGNRVAATKAARLPSQCLIALCLLGLTVGPLLFLSGQFLFLINLSKALFKSARRPKNGIWRS